MSAPKPPTPAGSPAPDGLALGRRTTPHPDDVRWSDLLGVRVTIGSVAGVIIGLDGPDWLRLAPLDGGEVQLFAPRFYQVSPMPADTFTPAKGSRRKVRCPAGRPIYRYGEIPEGILATATMLREQVRRLLPDALEPVASFLAGNEYYPMYAVADCTPMPEQTPGRRAAWAAVRACAWCGATSPTPWPISHQNGDARLCGQCTQSAREQRNAAADLSRRLGAERIARDILADPATVLVHITTTTVRESGLGPVTGADRQHVDVVDHRGEPVFSVDYDEEYVDGYRQPFNEAAVAALGQVRALLTGRTVVDLSEHAGPDLTQDVRAALADKDWKASSWHETAEWYRSGGFTRLVEDSDIAPGRMEPLPYRTISEHRDRRNAFSHRQVFDVEPPASPARLCWDLLHLIAEGPHPAGPARCPRRPSHVEPACGSTDLTNSGFCQQHRSGPGVREASS